MGDTFRFIQKLVLRVIWNFCIEADIICNSFDLLLYQLYILIIKSIIISRQAFHVYFKYQWQFYTKVIHTILKEKLENSSVLYFSYDCVNNNIIILYDVLVKANIFHFTISIYKRNLMNEFAPSQQQSSIY